MVVPALSLCVCLPSLALSLPLHCRRQAGLTRAAVGGGDSGGAVDLSQSVAVSLLSPLAPIHPCTCHKLAPDRRGRRRRRRADGSQQLHCNEGACRAAVHGAGGAARIWSAAAATTANQNQPFLCIYRTSLPALPSPAHPWQSTAVHSSSYTYVRNVRTTVGRRTAMVAGLRLRMHAPMNPKLKRKM